MSQSRVARRGSGRDYNEVRTAIAMGTANHDQPHGRRKKLNPRLAKLRWTCRGFTGYWALVSVCRGGRTVRKKTLALDLWTGTRPSAVNQTAESTEWQRAHLGMVDGRRRRVCRIGYPGDLKRQPMNGLGLMPVVQQFVDSLFKICQ